MKRWCSRCPRGAVFLVALAGFAAAVSGCSKDTDDDLSTPSFAAAQALTAAEAQAVVQRGAEAVDDPHLILAVVDRVGKILAVWRRNPASPKSDFNKAVAIARSAAFLSSSQGPLSSRTLEYLSTFHFPPTFGPPEDVPNCPPCPPQRRTLGVKNTPQGPLWQIFASNRGAPLAGPGLTVAETGVETLFNPGKDLPAATDFDGNAPGPGLGYLPGGIPLYKGGRVVGAVGAYSVDPGNPSDVPDIAVAEYAALQAAGPLAFAPIEPEGAIFLVGVLLPYVEQTSRPAGFGPGTFDPADIVLGPLDGGTDPDGYLIGPRADPLGNLSLADVQQIIDQGIATANGTRAAIRLPLGSTTRMVFAITNLDGLILALYRMEDAPIFSIDVSVAKARTVVYYSGPNVDPNDAIPGIPAGTAINTRTLGFLSQPAFPPTIDGKPPGPLYDVALENQKPSQYNRLGNAPFRPGLQSGFIFFPGSAPLYDSAGNLIGGIGVSGDGVEQDDFVTAGAVKGFEPPESIRADNFTYGGVRLPYFKFPQIPGPGGG